MMLRNNFLSTFLLLACIMHTTAQKGLQFFDDRAFDGYTLFEGDGTAYLVNNCGEEIHRWNNVQAQLHPKLLPNGNLLYIKWYYDGIRERDWEGNTINAIDINDPTIRLDYEIILMPNGNYLCLGRKDWSQAQFEEIGFDFGVRGVPFQVDVVVELNPDNGNVVWMWNIADHVIQERDENLANYGSVKDNPQLLNLDAISTFDWTTEESFMINGMDYNEELDQIVLSVRKMSEVIIIDHSTTTEEAAGHSGGNSGKGGDILYRWGNPQNYNRGTEDDRYLFYQHNPNWIHHGEHTGKITIYNNGLGRPGVPFNERYSSAPIIEPPMDENGAYIIDQNLPFEPMTPTEDFSSVTSGNDFYSSYTSGSKVLPNGNVYLTVGGDNRGMELLPDGTVVWDYAFPETSFTFRSEKYSKDYSAFEGKDLTPGSVIENPPSPVPCDLMVSTPKIEKEDFHVWIDNTSERLYIATESDQSYRFELMDMSGRTVKRGIDKIGSTSIDLDTNYQGIFVLNLRNEKGAHHSIKLFIR